VLWRLFSLAEIPMILPNRAVSRRVAPAIAFIGAFAFAALPAGGQQGSPSVTLRAPETATPGDLTFVSVQMDLPAGYT
jgi:hypothetical protein